MKALIPLSLAAMLLPGIGHASNYQAPEVLVPPSPFKGVHGLAVDHQNRLLAGSVVGYSMYQVDQVSGEVSTFIGPDLGQADDIAIGPQGEMAWTGFTLGKLLYRDNDNASIRVLAEGLPGINSVAFDQKNGKLYASQVFLDDALWEFDLSAQQPPRLIKRDMGGFNGFEVGSDGWLYGPLWFKGLVVRINPENGDMQTVGEGFGTPAAVNFDSQGQLFVVDTLSGQLIKLDPATGETDMIAQLASALDNLAIDAEDRIFVSNMADNSITEVNPVSGATRVIVQGNLAAPAGLSLTEDGKTLYVADVFSFRSVDTASGKVTDIRRAHGSDIEYPIAVGLGEERVLLTSFSTGTLHLLKRDDMSTLAMVHGLNAPSAAVELDDGSILVSELGSGALIQLSGPQLENRRTLAEGLYGPVQMIKGQDGQIYLTEAAGFLTRVNPANGEITRLAQDLQMPEGLVQSAEGQFIVAETAAKRLIRLDIASGERHILADNLPIGYPTSPGMPPSGIPTGLVMAADGTLYFSADQDNGIYRLRPAD